MKASRLAKGGLAKARLLTAAKHVLTAQCLLVPFRANVNTNKNARKSLDYGHFR